MRRVYQLPWPPTVNHYHQPIKMGNYVRVIKGTKAKQYAKQAIPMVAEQHIGEPITADIICHIDLRPPTRRKIDVDNHLKAVLDALVAGGAMKDDSQVVELVVKKLAVMKGGQATVELYERQEIGKC